jgi:hypothetical protein
MNILRKISQIFGDFGLLRLSLLSLCFISIGLSFFADGTTHLHDWRLVPSVLAPSTVIMLAFAIPLDITMAFIFKSDSDELEKPRYDRIIRVESIIYVLLLACWSPFFLKILS